MILAKRFAFSITGGKSFEPRAPYRPRKPRLAKEFPVDPGILKLCPENDLHSRETVMNNPELTSLNWAIEYEIPNLRLALTFMMAAETEAEALAEFRKRRPHGKITKINGDPVKDNGIVITESDAE
jgi:hypothetical protein